MRGACVRRVVLQGLACALAINTVGWGMGTAAAQRSDVDLHMQRAALQQRPNLLTISASVGELYDSNVTLTKRNRTSDLVTVLMAGLGFQGETKTNRISVDGRLRENIYARHSNFTNTAGEASVDWQSDLSKYNQFTLHDDFSSSKEPIRFEEEFGTASGRYSHTHNALTLSDSHAFSQAWTLSGSYGNEIQDVSRTGLSDSITHRGGVGSVYAIDAANEALADGVFAYREYRPGGSILAYTLAPGFRHFFTKQVSVEGRVGLDIFDPSKDKTEVSPHAVASLNHELDPQTVSIATIEHSATMGTYDPRVFTATRASLTLRRQLLRRLIGDLDAFFGHGTYRSIHRRDTFEGAGMGLRYELTSDLDMNAEYRVSNVNSNDNSRDYLRHTVFLGLTLHT